MTKILLAMLLCVGLPVGAFAATADDLKKTIEDNFAASTKEDMDTLLKTIHTQSPAFAGTKKVMEELNARFDLKYTLTDYNFIGEDADYAYARFKLQTQKVGGAEFKDNMVDNVAVFKKEDGVWKFWTQAILDVKFDK